MKKYNNNIFFCFLFVLTIIFFTSTSHAITEKTNVSATNVSETNVSELSTVEASPLEVKKNASSTVKTIAIKNTPKAPHQLSNYGASIAEMLFYLLLVIGLIFFLAWLVKKVGYNNGSPAHLMKVTACLQLTAKEKLMVVQIGDEQIVVGVAPGFVGHITSLKHSVGSHSLDDNSAVNKDVENTLSNENIDTGSFSNMLSKIIKGQV